MLSSFVLFAQHGLFNPIEPGSKGQLPATPEIDKTVPANFIGCLTVAQSYVSSVYFGGYSYECWLNFPQASEYGGEYWTLEYKYVNDDNWSTYTGSDSNPYHFTYNNATPYVHGTTQYRLRLHGGEKDGFRSNIVTVQRPSLVTKFGGWSDSEDMYTLVGSPNGKNLSLSVTTYSGDAWEGATTYDSGDETNYFVYKWYRRNPYNYEMTQIPGANERTYTPTIEDVGYVLVLEISGDGVHHSFTQTLARGIVQLPIRTSISYYGLDGFVLNTDYILPDEGKGLGFEEWNNDKEDYDYVTFPVSERKPGQYVCRQPMDEWMGRTVSHTNTDYRVIISYIMQWDESEEPTEWIREHQLMPDRYWAPLVVKPVSNGRVVPTTVDIIGRNIDDEWVVKRSIVITPDKLDGDTIQRPEFYYYGDEEAPDLEEGLYTFGDGYIIKAYGTDALATTYLGGTMLWSETTPIFPGEAWNDDKEDYDINSAVIEMVTAPKLAEEGIGVIEGCVAVVQENSLVKARRANALADADVYTVYLQKKGGDIVAMTETDAAGNYRFEKLPFDSYLVLVNIDGCIQENATEVVLSEAAPAAANINYTVEDGTITASTQDGIITISSAPKSQNIYSICGQRLSKLQRGLNIVGGKKVIVR